jgi:hypothetical protein
MGQVYFNACRSEWGVVHSSCHWYQLFLLVCGWIRLSVSDQEEELCMVEQVQLHYQCGYGQW